MKIFLFIVVILISYFYGIYSHKNNLFPYYTVREFILKHYYNNEYRSDISADTSMHKEVDCAKVLRDDYIFFVGLGQSNAANHGNKRFIPPEDSNIYLFYKNRCFLARDPLLGSTGNRGSVWTKLAFLLNNSTKKNIVIATSAIGGSSVGDWVVDDKLENVLLLNLLEYINKIHVDKPILFLWQQGETDAMNGTTYEEYINSLEKLKKIILNNAITFKPEIYISLTTLCYEHGVNKEIRKAQLDFVTNNGFYIGPDNDMFDSIEDRYDCCHLSELGQWKSAIRWQEIILESFKK